MPSAKPRAFVSYGWRDHAELVRRLKADLQADGWDVWHDKDRITGVDAFCAEIEDGIRWCDVVLAVLGPHSTRRANDLDSKDHRDSTCQRAISMADAVKGHGRIVPVMAVASTPPLLLQGIDHLDLIGCPQRSVLPARSAAAALPLAESAHQVATPFDRADRARLSAALVQTTPPTARLGAGEPSRVTR